MWWEKPGTMALSSRARSNVSTIGTCDKHIHTPDILPKASQVPQDIKTPFLPSHSSSSSFCTSSAVSFDSVKIVETIERSTIEILRLSGWTCSLVVRNPLRK
uniref:Uncharacterized protein n=1 Tax=Vespula pensylvanica TaxID=30213 RepID=A0A834PEN0_VESPE|nr:hypothetical protein H0235_000643 [Vespula pensylvanica]